MGVRAQSRRKWFMVERAKNILAEALQTSNPEERRAWLERACAGDEDLRREVESLLQAYEQAGDSTGHRSDSAPDQEPKAQPKWSGGPPRPPKKTARGLADGSPGDDSPLGPEEITRWLETIREGKPEAAEELLTRVYHELRELAAAKMAHEAPGQTLQPTALAHEAWLGLGVGNGGRFPDRAYFFAAAGEAMRRILVEIARRKKRLKHGGNLERVDIDSLQLAAPRSDEELLAVDDALNRLAERDPRAAELVKLLYFVELTQEQAAKELGISVATVERHWAFARAWLFREIQKCRNAPS